MIIKRPGSQKKLKLVMTNISYENTVYRTGPGLQLQDFQVVEDWFNRPASEWSVQRIGVLQSKIEQYTYKIYHNNRYGKHVLSKLIPRHVLVKFANECFGFSGWSMEVIDIETMECNTLTTDDSSEDKNTKYTVITEARVKITLKDGTNTEAGGFGRATTLTKGDSFSKAKKEAVGHALKKAFLGFEQIILDHEVKVDNNYYIDGLYGSKSKKDKVGGNSS